MMNDFEQFEQDLRSLVPIRCEHLSEATFYQAGWAAAQQLEVTRLQAINSCPSQTRWPQSGWYRHPVAVFSSGIAVGLMFFLAVLNGTTHRDDKEEYVASVEIPAENTVQEIANKAEGAMLNSVDEAQARLPIARPTVGTMSKMMASFFPWSTSSKMDVSTIADSPSGALSRAAQQQWDNLRQSDHVTCRHSSEAASDVSEPETRPLQVSPLRNGMMKEFL